MFINTAYAASAASAESSIMGFLPLIVIFVLFYFMLLRPQMRRAKEQRNMLEAMQKGDEVVTNGGLAGKVVKVGENFVSLEIAENTVVHIQKPTIQTLLPKGTIKGL
ncbi:MAG TPA: preprotein translocase subunit YajC [Betaproteobacteria bacterium]|nr:preprotein translocase subunit YajC [Betaproteobacteria bacterium]